MIEQTLHGHIVGLGKRYGDGSVDYCLLDRPIHNRIVSGGLDYLMTLNGSNSAIFSYDSSDSYNPYRRAGAVENSSFPYNGCLQYMSIGTDGTATAFTDTALKAMVGTYTDIPALTTLPNNASRMIDNEYSVQHRVTLQSYTVTGDTTVREVGFHGKYYQQEVYPLFCRIVLDNPVNLSNGESLIVTYQLTVSYSGFSETETPSSLLQGLLDSDGNQLRAVQKCPVCSLYGRSSDTGWNENIMCTFYMQRNGRGGYLSDDGRCSGYGITPLHHRCTRNSTSAGISTNGRLKASTGLSFSTNASYTFPAYMALSDSTNVQLSFIGTTNSCVVKDYVPGTYYRDAEVTVNTTWPNQSSGYTDIYAIMYNGLTHRFGYYDTTDPANPVWVPKPWRKEFGKSYKFTYRYAIATEDTVPYVANVGGIAYTAVKINNRLWTISSLRNPTTDSYVTTRGSDAGLLYPYTDFSEIQAMLSDGWRIPTQADFQDMIGDSTSSSPLPFIADVDGGNNSTGFSGQLTGYVDSSNQYVYADTRGCIWTNSEYNNTMMKSVMYSTSSIDTTDYSNKTITKLQIRLCKDA